MKYTAVVLLVIVVAAQVCYICYHYVYEKEGYHCDEVYSYALANSFYRPYIERDAVFSDEIYNVDEWLPGEVLHNYITVQQGEQFRYDSVWYNQANDRHPPLFYAALHTVCSFFPDTFSFWPGFILNLVYFVVMQIFFYKLIKTMLGSRYLALAACLMFGFTSGTLSMVLYQRMYCMMTMWTVIFFYLHARLYQIKESPRFRQLLPIILITVCGALTQYLFLFAAFITAAGFCLYYLFSKRFKALFAYGFSMLGGVALAMLAFPPMLTHLFSETSRKYPEKFASQMVILNRYLSSELFTLSFEQIVYFAIAILLILVIVYIVSLPVQFLLRDKAPVRNFYTGLLQKCKSVLSLLKTPKGWGKLFISMVARIRACSPLSLIMVTATIVIMCITSYSINFYFTGFVDRYIFLVFPLVIAAVTALIMLIFSPLKFKRVITGIVLTIFTAVNLCNVFSIYYFEQNGSLDDVKELTDGAQLIVTGSDTSYLTTFFITAAEFEHCDRYVWTSLKADKSSMEKIAEGVESDKPLYLVFCGSGWTADADGHLQVSTLDNPKNQEILDGYFEYIREIDGVDSIEYLGDYTIMSVGYHFYKVQ